MGILYKWQGVKSSSSHFGEHVASTLLAFSTGSPHPKQGFSCSVTSKAEPFGIHALTLNTNRSGSMLSFKNQSTPLDLDGEQCHLNRTPSISQFSVNAMARYVKGLLHLISAHLCVHVVHAAAGACQM